MYNLYIYKKKSEYEKKQKKIVKYKEKLNSVNKVKNEKHIANYDKRVKNFILDMGSHPIKINDLQNISYNIREEDLKDFDKFKKPFSYAKFKTDKERIEDYLNSIQELSAFKKDKPNTILSSIQQPLLRFKPRLDIERIYDEANDYRFGRIPSDLLKEHLSKVNLSSSKNNNKKPYQNMKNIKINLAKANSLSRVIMEDLHKKTHFKAAQSLTLDIHNTQISNILKTDEQFILYDNISHDYFNKLARNPIELTTNPEISENNLNYLKLQINNTSSDGGRLINSHRSLINNGDRPSIFFNIEQNGNIKLNSEVFDLSKMDMVTRKVLEKCNYINVKSKSNNSILKKGEGKTMITNGLSLNQFKNKFNIPL